MAKIIVPVIRIENIKPHDNADNLEIVEVGGWQVVTGKGNVQIGDLVVHFPPQAVLPVELSDRLGVTKYLSNQRVKVVKLRGEASHGFIAPFDEVMPNNEGSVSEGNDLMDELGIIKYDPPIKSRSGDAAPEVDEFPKYTSIENMRNHQKVFEDGEPVVVTEKVHGCCVFETPIIMMDGSKKRIIDVQVGDEVMGVDDNGNVVSSKVLNKFNNGKADKWLNIKGKRTGCGRGNSYFSVKCTPNHKFYVEGKYVEAEKLSAGDGVTLLRMDNGNTVVQDKMLIGKMIGDGCLRSNKYSAHIEWSHKKENEDYIDLMRDWLGDRNRKKGKRISGYGTEMIVGGTLSSAYIKQVFDCWIVKGKKIVPKSVVEKFSPISAAFWYMDDGSLAHNDGQEDRVSFATCGFDDESCDILVKCLKKIGVESSVKKYDGYNRIVVNADNADVLFTLIAPYFPESMQYKLPERYRGCGFWKPKRENVFKPMLVGCEIESIEDITEQTNSDRWDIETETHNFFANGVLVHNSNSRIGMIDGEMFAGSKGVRRKPPQTPDGEPFVGFEGYKHHTYWFPWSLESVQDMMSDLYADETVGSVILYGEIYGPRIQKLGYGLENNEIGYVAFDMKIDDEFVPYDKFVELCDQYGVPRVPEITKMEFDYDKVAAMSEGGTLLGGDHIREGVVVKPLVEGHDPKIGRRILKFVSSDYLCLGYDEDPNDL